MSVADIHPLVLGTMRLAEKGLSAGQVTELLQASASLGVNALHVSSEYASFELLAQALKSLSATERHHFKLIAKIAGPHFDATHFSATDLTQRIDSVLQALGIEQLAIAQWMWRLNPLDDDLRLSRMTEQAHAIREAFSALMQSGKVAEFGCFPYSDRFMHKAFELNLASSHINYLNPWEVPLYTGGFAANSTHETAPLSQPASAIAMRPLGAGKMRELSSEQLQKISERVGIEHQSAFELCLHMAFCHPQVRAVVVSCSRPEQVLTLTEQLSNVPQSEALFHDYLAATEIVR